MKFEHGSVMLCIIVLVIGSSCQPDELNARKATLNQRNLMITQDSRTGEEAAIQSLLDNFVKSIRAKDINGVMSIFSPDVVSFDLGPPLQHGGGPPFVRRWQELFNSYQGPIQYEIRDLSVAAGEDVAFSHSLNRISGVMKNGQTTERWLRWTACYRKSNGKWRIVHEQVSVPADVRSGRAMLDLKP